MAQTKEIKSVHAVHGSGAKPYRVELYVDGTAYCTCPGWQFRKGVPADERECKHTAQVRKQVGYKGFRNGADLDKDEHANSYAEADHD